MGIKLETDDKGIKVIRKDGTSKAGNPYTMYSLMYSFKVGEEWKNGFIDAGFKKGVDLANKSKIIIKDAFLTGTEFNGTTKPKIIVMDFDVLEGGDAPKPVDDGAWMNIPDGIDAELPFN
jgi:hypothetical protein